MIAGNSYAVRFWRSRLKSEYWSAKYAFISQAPSEEALRERIGEVLADRYVLRAKIGGGGFANVYRALDQGSDIDVAIKILFVHGELAQHQRRRFERETAALERISHPGVVPLLDKGWISEAEPYLVMGYIDGPHWQKFSNRATITGEGILWLRQLGDALAEGHRIGILHRDLKPQNIMIQDFGKPAERVVVVDFGAAAMPDQDRSSSLELGSLPYLAPEQVQGRSYPTTDVYAFTAIAFEMLTGVRYASLADGSESGLRAALAGFPGELVALLAVGLSYSPADRPSDIRLIAEDLATILGRPLVGPPPHRAGPP